MSERFVFEKELERSLPYAACVLLKYGKASAPIFHRLERELEASQQKRSPLARGRAVLAHRLSSEGVDSKSDLRADSSRRVKGAPESAGPTPLAYGVKDAATVLGISRSSLYKMIADGKIRVGQIDGRMLIRHDELARVIDGIAFEKTKRNP